MSSTTTTTPPPPSLLLGLSSDPVYGSVYALLERNYIGSWGDACVLYDNIRREAIWTELTGLVRTKPTEAKALAARELLNELEHVDTSLSFIKADGIVRKWAPSAVPKIAIKNSAVFNAFHSLAEDSDEE